MDNAMTSKEQVITEIITLVEKHHISMEELTAALGRQQIEAGKKDPSTLTRVFSYLGGIFILSGLGTYIATIWNELNSFSRVLVTFGPGIICLILAVAMAMKDRRAKNINILIILSALFQPSGLFVALHEFVRGGGDISKAALLVFGVMALQYGLFFFRLRLTALLFFTIYFSTAAFASLCELIHMPYDMAEFICGTSILALSYGIQRTPYNSICGFGYFVSSITLLWMGFDMVENTPFDILYLAIASFMLYISTIIRSRSVMVTSAIAIFAYISYFTNRHFVNSLGWPVCLILLGFVFFGISHLTLKLHKRLKA
jgi:hypothetical protein